MRTAALGFSPPGSSGNSRCEGPGWRETSTGTEAGGHLGSPTREQMSFKIFRRASKEEITLSPWRWNQDLAREGHKHPVPRGPSPARRLAGSRGAACAAEGGSRSAASRRQGSPSRLRSLLGTHQMEAWGRERGGAASRASHCRRRSSSVLTFETLGGRADPAGVGGVALSRGGGNAFLASQPAGSGSGAFLA